jgi:hypothetical protein
MKKRLAIALIMAIAAELAGCGFLPEQRTPAAAAPEGAGPPQPRCMRWGNDVYGTPVCIAYSGH